MADPFTIVALGATVIGGLTSAAGSVSSGNAQAAAFQYQSGVAQMNQQIVKQNADYAIATGEVDAQRQDLQTRFKTGQTVAQQGASNIAVGSGSNSRVVQSEREIGAQDSAIIRSDAAK